MNNANMPAAPTPAIWIEDLDNPINSKSIDSRGLTKREYFAGLAMQGLASDSQFAGDLKEMAVCAVSWADALLEELEAAK